MNSSELSAYLDGLVELNTQWIRFDFPWSTIQPTGPGSFNWAAYDHVVSEVSNRGISILGMIGYTPLWARPPGCTSSNKCAPNTPSEFATFAAAVADRYKNSGVHHWEIWNEPNISTFWKPFPSTADYSTLLAQSYAAIMASNSTAFIVSGGLSPAVTNGTNISPIDFLTAMYAEGVSDSFDALGHHPYCFSGTFDCPNTYALWSAWSQMEDTPVNLRDIMISNGDTAKKIWITEFGAPTSGSGATSETQQASMIEDAFTIAESKSWIGPLFLYSYRDVGTNPSNREDWFGITRNDGSHKPAYDTLAAITFVPTSEISSPSREKVTPAKPVSSLDQDIVNPAPGDTTYVSAPDTEVVATQEEPVRIGAESEDEVYENTSSQSQPAEKNGPTIYTALIGIGITSVAILGFVRIRRLMIAAKQ